MSQQKALKVVIIGGVAGGASTAARLRRKSEEAQIIMFEKGNDISYANCGIPYYIGDVITDRTKLNIISRDEFAVLFNVDVRTRTEVISINRKEKYVEVKDLSNNNTYTEKYDRLVLSPGGTPIRPPLPGINDSRIFTLRNLDDMDTVKNYINEKKPGRAIVIGAGFIGLEVAENLQRLHLKVSIVEMAEQVMTLLDYEMACVIHQHLHTKQVALYLKDGIREFKQSRDCITAVLQSGREIAADMVILAIGVKPEIKLAADAGITIGKLGGISVNEKMETSDAAIYALGDAAEIIDSVTGNPALIPLANSANKQGRIVADNILGYNRRYSGTPGTVIAKIFDLTAASTGVSEKKLKREGIAYSKTYLQPASHAGYYPDAYPMVFKLLFADKTGQVLGAQIIGIDGVDKRIDTIASVIHNKGTVYDLAELELAYAPPYNAAKDAVNLAGMSAINQLETADPVIFWDQVKEYIKTGALFIDVRTSAEYQIGHIEGAINIPLEEMRARVKEISGARKIVVYCSQGKKAYFALCLLRNLGFTQVKNLSGGFKLYQFTIQKQENIGIFDDIYVDKTDEMQYTIPSDSKTITLDACGLQCPGPILKLAKAIDACAPGDIVQIISTDTGFLNDAGIWCERTGNKLLSIEESGMKITARIEKGIKKEAGSAPRTEGLNDKTIIVFSNDLDRALASFIIASGAASMGRKVTMFFTFWGLNVLRKGKKQKVKKNIIEKMFGLMMPRGSARLKLSKLNMMGMGTAMMKGVMKSKNISSLEELITNALDSGIRLVACQMTMDMMGIKSEELIEGVQIGGVASYLGAAESADTNLFI